MRGSGNGYGTRFGFEPIVMEWFASKFGAPTDVQLRAWEAVAGGEHTLIAAPTGSGKTLAAALPCLDAAIKRKWREPAEKGVKTLYITPLKALNHDIHDHVVRFAEELDALARERSADWPGIRVGVRTGDTPQSTRSSMLKQPPDLLVTTPESLYLMLTSPKARDMLRTVRQVVVDEIHSLVPDPRGAHLSLSLERLAALCGSSPQRIGVSATQKPLETAASFLGGWEEGGRARTVRIVESAMDKPIALTVTVPDPLESAAANREAVWAPILDRIVRHMGDARTTLIFVNSRRLCERMTLRLNDRFGYEAARSHHGSVSREKRLEAERMLRDGELRCVVATSSLELGIDVGHVERVIQIDSPMQAASGIQRIGRAGHAVDGVSEGVIVARMQGQLAEIAVLSRQIANREIEPLAPVGPRLDVLAQQCVAIAAGGPISLDALHALIVRSDVYRGYPRERLERLLEVLAGTYPFVKPLLDWDRVGGRIAPRRNTLMAAITGAGTIPRTSNYPVVHAESRVQLGELDEEFVHESRTGDVFQLGAGSWMIRSIEQDRVLVGEAANAFSEIPFWRNDAGGRSFALGAQVGAFHAELEARTAADRRAAAEWLAETRHFDAQAAERLVSLFERQMRGSWVPTDRRLVIEHFRDVADQTHVVLHSVWGLRFNRTWLMALRDMLKATLPYEFYANAKDGGIEFVFPEWKPAWMEAIWGVRSDNIESWIRKSLPESPLYAITFRRMAQTALLLARGYGRMPMWQQRLRSVELLRESLPFAERFPFLTEAADQCLREHLDVPHVRDVLARIEQGDIEVAAVTAPFPSPLASQFLADYVNMRIYEAETLQPDLQLQLRHVNKELAARLFGESSLELAVDPDVLRQEQVRLEGVSRPVADAQDLYALFKMRGDMSREEAGRLAGDSARDWIRELLAEGKLERVLLHGEERLICADEKALYDELPHTEASIAFILKRHMEHLIRFEADDLRARYGLSEEEASRVISAWREQGIIEPAPFGGAAGREEWTGRKVAARIVRRSLEARRGGVRQEDAAVWCARLLRDFHLRPDRRLEGGEGLRAVIARLQGFFFPLSHWESLIFPSRLKAYRKQELDGLCASGEIVWIGRKGENEKEGSVAFFLAESKELIAPWLAAQSAQPTKHPGLLRVLETRGASFLTAIAREAGMPPSEALAALLDLVWEGRASNDQFAPLRLAQSARKADFAKTGSGQGRWYALSAAYPPDGEPDRSVTAWTHHLLASFRMATRDMASATPYSWDTLQGVLRRLEEWGLVTRGLFIRGVDALQYAAKEAYEEMQSASAPEERGMVMVSAADPANPFGWWLPWPRLQGAAPARKAGHYLVFLDGRWIMWIENDGKRLVTVDSERFDPAAHIPALISLLRDIRTSKGMKKIVIETWNGRPAADSPGAEWLKRAGAEPDRGHLVFWPSAFE